MTRLLLVRHGETEWNAQRRLQGQRDLPLSDAGRGHMRALAGVVSEFAPDHAVASPLVRASESCQLLGYADHEVDLRWQEADLGLWEGERSTDLSSLSDGSYARWRAGRHTPPLGEPFQDMCKRVAAAVADLAGSGFGTVLVVTHGGPIRAACSLLVGLDPGSAVPVAPASLTILELVGPATARLRSYNVTALPPRHLS